MVILVSIGLLFTVMMYFIFHPLYLYVLFRVMKLCNYFGCPNIAVESVDVFRLPGYLVSGFVDYMFYKLLFSDNGFRSSL